MKDEYGQIMANHGYLTYQDSEDIKEVVCMYLCKHVSEYKDPDDMEREVCCVCPLVEKLIEYEDD